MDGQGRTILVADDETHILNVVSIKLRNAGFGVISAEDGVTAYRLAVSHAPDLIITDCQMPGLSGLELSSRLFSDARTRSIPIILLTARGFTIAPDLHSRSNLRATIAKPFSPRAILERVHELLADRVMPLGA